VVFISSMKYAMGVFFFPIWWLSTAVLIAYLFGNSIMTAYLLLCVSALFLRQSLKLS